MCSSYQVYVPFRSYIHIRTTLDISLERPIGDFLPLFDSSSLSFSYLESFLKNAIEEGPLIIESVNRRLKPLRRWILKIHGRSITTRRDFIEDSAFDRALQGEIRPLSVEGTGETFLDRIMRGTRYGRLLQIPICHQERPVCDTPQTKLQQFFRCIVLTTPIR